MSIWSMRLGYLVLAVLVVGLAESQNEEDRRASGQESSRSNSQPLSALSFRSILGPFCVWNERELGQLQDGLYEMQTSSSLYSTEAAEERDCQQWLTHFAEVARRLNGVFSGIVEKRYTDHEFDAVRSAFEVEVKTLDENLLPVDKEADRQGNPLAEEVRSKIRSVQSGLRNALEAKITVQTAYDQKKMFHDYFKNLPVNILNIEAWKGPPSEEIRYYGLCRIKSEWFSELLDSLQGALVIATSAGRTDPAEGEMIPHPQYASTNCSEIISLVNGTIEVLKFIFKDSTSSEEWKTARHSQLNTTFEAEISNRNQRIVDLRQKTTQNSEDSLNEIQSELESQNISLNTALEENENFRERLKNETGQFCIYFIKRGDYGAAKQQFSELNAEEQLGKIVKSAYDSNLSNAEHVLSFIRSLPRLSEFALGYEVLFEEMERSGHLGTPQALRLACQIDEAMHIPPNPDVPQNTKDKFYLLAAQIKPYSLNITKEVARLVREGDHDSAHAYLSEVMKAALTVIDIFNVFYLPEIVHHAYEDEVDNVDNILVFIGKLTWASQLGLGYTYVLNEMKHRGHLESPQLVTLAYKLKEPLGLISSPEMKESAHYFKDLQSQLPESIVNLFWSSSVFIQSKLRNDPGLFLNGNRMGTHVCSDKSLVSSRWTVEAIDGGRFFRFKTKQDGLALYADNEGNLFSGDSRDDKRQYWQVFPLGSYFYLRNIANGRILGVSLLYPKECDWWCQVKMAARGLSPIVTVYCAFKDCFHQCYAVQAKNSYTVRGKDDQQWKIDF